MSEGTDEVLEDVLDCDDVIVEELTLDEIRARRATCQGVETGLSYLRRMVQGRLDLVDAEVSRRSEDGTDSVEDLEALIARLPSVLAGSTRTDGNGRLPQSLGEGAVDERLAVELDGLIERLRLDEPDSLTDGELGAARAELQSYERRISDLRRRAFERIDSLEAELTRRYRTGEATVDGLLH